MRYAYALCSLGPNVATSVQRAPLPVCPFARLPIRSGGTSMIRSLKGKTPKIDPTAFVSEAAYVVGDVTIGPGSSVWPGSVIRGESPIVIGRNVCVQDNSTIHADGRGATIGD